jgi:hypothetical protein
MELAMRNTIGIALALMLASGAAMAQDINSAGSASGAAAAPPASVQPASEPTTTGSATTDGMGSGMQRAPIGHVQPRPSDFPQGYLDDIRKRSPEDETLDRKLNICRDC